MFVVGLFVHFEVNCDYYLLEMSSYCNALFVLSVCPYFSNYHIFNLLSPPYLYPSLTVCTAFISAPSSYFYPYSFPLNLSLFTPLEGIQCPHIMDINTP